MRVTIPIVSLYALLQATLVHAQIYVGTTSAGPGISYAKLADAILAASAGDTLYANPGDYSAEPEVILTKSLTIIGPGYRHLDNFPQQTSFASGAKLPDLRVECSDCQVRFIGLWLDKRLLVKGAESFTLENSYVRGLFVHDVETLLIHSNYFFASQNYSSVNATIYVSAIRQAYLTNNIFEYTSVNVQYYAANITNFLTSSQAVPPSYVLYEHNLFKGTPYLATGCVAVNNIFNSSAVATIGPSSATYNVGLGSCTSTGPTACPPGYTAVANLSLVFADWTGSQGQSFDGRYQLASQSPALGAGVDGVDCGPFGGSSPYKLSGVSENPLVTKLQVPLHNSQTPSVHIQALIR